MEEINLGNTAPEQSQDDLLFEQLFSEFREQTRMARLMGVSRATVARQIKTSDENHPSDYHRARRLAYAAGFRGDEKGEQLKTGIDEAFEAGVKDAGAGGAQVPDHGEITTLCLKVALADSSDKSDDERRKIYRRLKRVLDLYLAGGFEAEKAATDKLLRIDEKLIERGVDASGDRQRAKAS